MAELPSHITLALDAVTFSTEPAEYRAAVAHAERVVSELPEGEDKAHIERNFATRRHFAAARIDWTRPRAPEARKP